MSERAFSFLHVNERESKPRTCGITEICGPYYTPMGKRSLEDLLETMGDYVDSLKFAGGSFTLMPKPALTEIIDLAHHSNVLASNGAEVNLFVDHSQIVQLECLRSGLWGTKSLWGRVVTYKGVLGDAEGREEHS